MAISFHPHLVINLAAEQLKPEILARHHNADDQYNYKIRLVPSLSGG